MDKIIKLMAWFIIPAPAIYAFAIWSRLPESVPIHYNLLGEADRYGTKDDLGLIVMVLTVSSAIAYLLIAYSYRFDPKKSAGANKSRLLRIGFAMSLVITIIHGIILYNSLHQETKISTHIIVAVIGLSYCLLGNYMFNLKPNYFAGLRVPWALENEENWRKTHRLAGKLYFFGGLFIAITGFIIPKYPIYAMLILVTVAITIIPVFYSYNLYRKQKKIKQTNI